MKNLNYNISVLLLNTMFKNIQFPQRTGIDKSHSCITCALQNNASQVIRKSNLVKYMGLSPELGQKQRGGLGI